MYNLDDSKPLQINYLLLSFIIIQIIFIIAGIATIINQLSQNSQIKENDPASQPHISIKDFSQEITNFPSDRIDFVQNSLLDIVQINSSNVDLGEVKAEVRDHSIYEHYFELPNLNYSSAIVDIPELGQSYQLFLQSSDDMLNRNLDPNGTIIFLCIKEPSDIIYQDFNCVDTYSQKTRNSIVNKYLKYFDFGSFYTGFDEFNYEDIVIVPTDFNQINEERFIQETKEAIRSLGISPDLFNYRIMRAEEYNFKIN